MRVFSAARCTARGYSYTKFMTRVTRCNIRDCLKRRCHPHTGTNILVIIWQISIKSQKRNGLITQNSIVSGLRRLLHTIQ